MNPIAFDIASYSFVDIKQYIGHPSADACYAMLRGSILELQNKDVIISKETIESLSVLKKEKNHLENGKDANQCGDNGHINGAKDRIANGDEVMEEDEKLQTNLSCRIYKEAQRCQGLSGRTLRKLPFLTMTEFHHGQVSGHEFVKALNICITSLKNDLNNVEKT